MGRAILVSGFMTNFCRETTTHQGHDLDFHEDFLLDATAAAIFRRGPLKRQSRR
jgi:nicotinamidase-related amidase